MKPSLPPDMRPVTVPGLHDARAQGRKLTMLTAYDAGFARMVDAAGIDLILVGDSLGMVVQGAQNTLGVSVEAMAYHTRCVAAVVQRALIVTDLPFLADATAERALAAAQQFLGAGAGMVKLEGAGPKLDIIRFLSEREIPVCAHLGLTPQSVLRLGGFRVQGRGEDAAQRLLREAQEVQDAGATLLVLEAVPSALATQITQASDIPIIGIGAGPGCDGQVLVLHDMLGLDSGHRRPRFVRDFLQEGGSIAGALAAYRDAVCDGSFPDAAHSYEA